MAVDERFGRVDRVMLAAGDVDGLSEATVGEFAGEAAVLKGNEPISRIIRNRKTMAIQRTDL
jgi:hypothetical protein